MTPDENTPAQPGTDATERKVDDAVRDYAYDHETLADEPND